ncbi:hypothetical protein R6Q57_008496, partial [Mikania cordata]
KNDEKKSKTKRKKRKKLPQWDPPIKTANPPQMIRENLTHKHNPNIDRIRSISSGFQSHPDPLYPFRKNEP